MTKTSKKLLVSLSAMLVLTYLIVQYVTSNKDTEQALSVTSTEINPQLEQLTKSRSNHISSEINMHGQDLKNKPESINSKNNTHASINVEPSSKNKKSSRPELITHQTPLKDVEIKSIQQIIGSAATAINKKMTSKQFMTLLANLKLQPKFMDQGSSALGSFVTIRTNNTLEGTRYIHAQFTGQYKNADVLQHISFQVRPGKDSFEQASKILDQALPKDRVVKESFDDYVLYTTSNGYVAWAKIADRDDLKGIKYNASSNEDIGTVIVTIEQEIHNMDDHDHQGHSH